MSKALQFICDGNKANNRLDLGMSFMIKDETQVKQSFGQFRLERTSLNLEYATVKPNRWDNYGWYSNTDLPMIKRLKKKK